ncbi:MAG: hypothetical protein ACYDD1_04695 [Caulobacteraceae bacterium]
MATLSGGDALEKRLQQIAEGLASGATLRVGFLENATYPDGTLVALVAASQNFGAPGKGIPPRPFFSNMIAANSPAWGDQLAKALAYYDNDVFKALEGMGVLMTDQLRDAILTFQGAPLSPRTIAAKGFDKALVDTSVMLNSIGSEVNPGVDP